MDKFLFRLLLVGLLAAGIGWGVLFGPHWIAYYKQDNCVANAALRWSDVGEDKGKIELKSCMEKAEIPSYLLPEDCRFFETPDKDKTVQCEWYVDVEVPMLGLRRQKFNQTAVVGPNNRLK